MYVAYSYVNTKFVCMLFLLFRLLNEQTFIDTYFMYVCVYVTLEWNTV